MRVPITTNFSKSVEDTIGYVEFSDEGIKKLYDLIKLDIIPSFGVGFSSDQDEDGKHKNIKLFELSMLTHQIREEEE